MDSDRAPTPKISGIIFLLLFAHVLLILLACTNFTAFNWLRGVFFVECEYFSLSYHYGFGGSYESKYSLLQVLTYLAGYALGIPVFIAAWNRGLSLIGACGGVICVLGFASFQIEATHWVWNHNLSLIASLPTALAVLWILWALVALMGRRAEVGLEVET